MKRLVLFVAAFLVAGCGVKFNPPSDPFPPVVTNPPVTTTPPVVVTCEPMCIGEGKTECTVLDHGVCRYVCKTEWKSGGVTLVAKKEDCPKPPTPEEPVVQTGKAFPAGHPPFTGLPGRAATQLATVNAAIEAVLGCKPGSAGCVWHGTPVQAFDALGAKIRVLGTCAGRYDDDHSGGYAGSDSLAVAPMISGDCSDIWEEFSVVNYGGTVGNHATKGNSYEGSFQLNVKPVETSTFPPIAKLSRNGISVRLMAGYIVDATPLTGDRDYCKKEFPDNSDQWTLCPFSGEDDPEKGIVGRTARRIAGERAAGPYSWTYNGQPWEMNNGNPLQIKVETFQAGGVAKLCAVNYGDPKCEEVRVGP